MFDFATCRFTGIDPIADQFAFVSPFNYAENEPIRNIDLHGLQKYDMMGLHDPNAQASFEEGGIEQWKEDKNVFFDNSGWELLGMIGEMGIEEIPGAGEALSIAEGDISGAVLGAVPIIGGPLKSLKKLFKSGGTKAGKRAGKPFTKKTKQELKEENTKQNNGFKCQDCSVSLVDAKKSKKGVKPPSNEAQYDHIFPKSQGGNGDKTNGQVLCRDCNRKKSDKKPDEYYKNNKDD